MQVLEPAAAMPRHIAIIMDGNGRWAARRQLPRVAGHRAGVNAARDVVRACAERGIAVLTLFAFSSENWRRPQREVLFLMDLLLQSLEKALHELHDNGVRLRFIGDRTAFAGPLRESIAAAERLTAGNPGLTLVVAVNYGGRWDLTQALRGLAEQAAAGRIDPGAIDEALVGRQLSLSGLPEPDLFIRTAGEQRISNFLLWDLAYTELYFADCLWPDFSPAQLQLALQWYAGRERRFGRITAQLDRAQGA
ncbi:MAG: polyprenyl diphosphate synthase [Gammaproteobacteria bacterium]